jgi:lipoprotein-releasing system ATP-binding protein
MTTSLASEPADVNVRGADDPPLAEVVYRASGLWRRYVMGGKVLEVVAGATLDIHRGEVIAIVGRSGAGKSTLLHLLGLLDRPDAGELNYRGQDLTRLSRRALARVRGEAFGFIFQFYHLLGEFTALENVMMPALVRRSMWSWWRHRAEARERAADLLTRVGLEQRMEHRPGQLSGGERQRVAIARALMNQPAVVFCDEPTGNLDRGTAERVESQLLDLARMLGQAFVIVTHDDALGAKADRMLRMEDGRLLTGALNDEMATS